MASLSPGGHSLDRWQPILVEGRLWGTIVVSSRKELLPPDTEERLERFTDLIATAIANAETSQARAQLGEEQEALRRVATLVAEGVNAQDVFDAVCRETCRLCDATTTSLSRFTPDGINLTMAGWSMHDTHFGMRLPIEPDTVADAIVRTHTPARVDSWAGRSGELAKLLRERGVRSSLGAPIVVDGQLWGALIAGSHRVELLPPATEFRLARFTELVATAISNTATRSELIASRARIVTAGDEARQRIERNLRDGTQQRLIALGLDIQRVRALIPEDQHDAHLGLERAGQDLHSVLEDLRELSRGLHPPLLARRGLRSALSTLARDSPIPVELEVRTRERSRSPLRSLPTSSPPRLWQMPRSTPSPRVSTSRSPPRTRGWRSRYGTTGSAAQIRLAAPVSSASAIGLRRSAAHSRSRAIPVAGRRSPPPCQCEPQRTTTPVVSAEGRLRAARGYGCGGARRRITAVGQWASSLRLNIVTTCRSRQAAWTSASISASRPR